jgi:glycosyltransferase involved in cell wall biosynthesis
VSATLTPRVLVPTAAWPDHRFPQWAVDALRAAGARVSSAALALPLHWDAVLVPAVRPPADTTPARRAGRRVIRLLDLPLRADDPHVREAETVVAPSDALARSWPGAVSVVRPAVPPRAGAARVSVKTFRVACTAPLHWAAGHEYALVAVAALVERGRRVELRIAGDGPAEEAIRYTAFDLGIEDVVTFLPAGAGREVLASADALLLPATEDRAWTALLDAFAYDVPAVASDLPTVRELAGGDRPAALLVPPRDADALAAALDSLAADTRLRADLSARARLVARTDQRECGRALLAAGRTSAGRSPREPAGAGR